jgi:molybdate transport system substrate-binding protein
MPPIKPSASPSAPDRRSFLRRLTGHLPLASIWLGATGAGLAQALTGADRHLRIAAASDLKFALAQLSSVFQQQTGIVVVATYGSSGNFSRQISQGLPVDVFMSADEAWVQPLVNAGLAQGPGAAYARGRLALLAPSASPLALDAQLKGVQALWPQVHKFAIANPEHAPYGRAAQQALQALGLWASVKTKLVLGENIAQATQFVTTGAAQAGITALPLARAPEVAALCRHIVLPANLHAPLVQRMVVLKTANSAAAQWVAYMQSDVAKQVLLSFGFEVS